MSQGWINIGLLDDIPRLGARCVKTGSTDIAVFRAGDDRVFAIVDSCPHRGGPLSQGIVHDCRVTCPLHNWVIDLESGSVVGPDEGQVRTIAVKVEDDTIFMDRSVLDDVDVVTSNDLEDA